MTDDSDVDPPNLVQRPPLKIEMVLAQLYVGGMEVMVTHLVRALRARGHRVGVTCIMKEGPLFEQLQADGFRMHVVPSHGWRNLVSPRTLIAWFHSEAPDIVHIHSGAWVKAAIAGKRAGTRVVFTHHGLESRQRWLDRVFNRYAARHTDRIVAVSEDLKEKMQRDGGLWGRRIDVLPNGVPTDEFSPERPAAPLKQTLGIPVGGRIIGNVARMWPVKNHLGLIDAFARLRKRRTDVFLVLVGDGPLRSTIEGDIARRGLSDCVLLTGEMEALAGIYRAFDLFALASLSEGTSISILEAMSSGIAVVATAVGGTPRLLGDGEFGTLVPPNDASAFAEALDRMLNDNTSRNRIATASREHVSKHFSVDVMCDAYEAMYVDRDGAPNRRTNITRSAQECVG